MAVCETCGNSYDKPIRIIAGESEAEHVFDSFECAIAKLAPTCATCGIRILGHGLEVSGTFYCCNHCATRQGETRLQDRVQQSATEEIRNGSATRAYRE